MVSVQVAVLALLAIGGDQTVLLDFYADWCGPCQEMHSTVDELARKGYPVKKVNIDRQPELAARYGAERIPCFVVVSNGRAVARHVGQASLQQLMQMFPSQLRGRDQADGDSPAIDPRAIPIPMIPDTQSDERGETADESILLVDEAAGSGSGSSPRADGPGDAMSRLMAASVRLKVDDPDGHSYGSGTIIDAQGGEALVLTCAHVFRDSHGKGPVSVDLFGDQAPQGLPARVVSYDLETDVGLVSFRTDGPVQAIRVAPAGHQVRSGDEVISIGCNNGDPPTARRSRVTGMNKFLGPPNLQVAGQPVTGRSGGGLFTPEGLVIGVCNAADPTDNEGLYAALASIHAELNRAHLSEVYGRDGAELADAASGLPRMPDRMPSSEPNGASPGVEGGNRGPALPGGGRQLSSQEQAALEEISQQADSAEVICIIRSLSRPRNKSEIIVLDRASADFLRSLADERHVQDARHLTSFDVRRSQTAGASSSARHLVPLERKPAKKVSHWRPNWRHPAETESESQRGSHRRAGPKLAAAPRSALKSARR